MVKIFDHETIRIGKQSAFLPFQIRQAGVVFPKVPEITFVLYDARHKAVSAGNDFWAELQELETEEERPKPVEDITDDSRPEGDPGAAMGSFFVFPARLAMSHVPSAASA